MSDANPTQQSSGTPSPVQRPSATEAYSQLGSEIVQQVAQVFMRHFQQVPDQRAQQYAQTSPHAVSSADVADMHEYASQSHPSIFGEIMKHPQVIAALGAFAERELHQLLHSYQANVDNKPPEVRQ